MQIKPGVFITAAAVGDFFDAHTLEAAGWIRRDENGAWQSPANMSREQAEKWCDANRRGSARRAIERSAEMDYWQAVCAIEEEGDAWRWASGKVLPNEVDGTYWRQARDAYQELLEAHPVTIADLRALDAEIEKRKKRRRWRLDYSKLTPEELLEFRAILEKMQVPDDGEADAEDSGGVGPKEG